MMNTNAALQMINFDSYGDSLIAIRVNATGEAYTVINYVLRGTGFTEPQIKHLRKKWSKDSIATDGVQNFVTHDDPGRLQDINYISMCKFPLALARINIIPKMKRRQPELASRLELYQDKCADVLTSVFLDNRSVSAINLQPLIDTIIILSSSIVTMQQDIISIKLAQENLQKQIPKKHFSFWTTKMFSKYQLLMDYFGIRENKDLHKELHREFCNMHPDTGLNQVIDDYYYENKLNNCYTLGAIEHDRSIRTLFEAMADGLLKKYGLMSNSNLVRQRIIFDDVVENISVSHQKGPIISE